MSDRPPPVELVWPALPFLPGYTAALDRGWCPDTVRDAVRLEELEQIAIDPAGFLARQVDREGSGPPVVLPDGTSIRRLPGYNCWIWVGEFCGRIGFRWQPGGSTLPPQVLGHIGYAVVPWKRGRGYARQALALLLPQVKAEGLTYVELITDPDNLPSQRVITANGGRVIERFQEPAAYGGAEGVRYRIDIA